MTETLARTLPAGLVHFGCARRDRSTMLRSEHFGPLGRGPIRVKALEVLMELLEAAVTKLEDQPDRGRERP